MEYNYPIYKQWVSDDKKHKLVVKFTSKNTGPVMVSIHESYWSVGDTNDTWMSHTSAKWKDYNYELPTYKVNDYGV